MSDAWLSESDTLGVPSVNLPKKTLVLLWGEVVVNHGPFLDGIISARGTAVGKFGLLKRHHREG